ncbi:S41 family peptidase [Candidatus Daviesbacteria bacterium]|nr:S41 family peptidase [Candidatus Daviesbacteria bacterium]
MNFLRKINLTAVTIYLLIFYAGWQLGHYDIKYQLEHYKPTLDVKNLTPPQNKQNLDFKLFWDTWDKVSREYVDKKAVDPQKMYYGAIQGMVAALGDPYTFFLPPDIQKSTKEVLGGSFEGVGIQLGFNKDKRLVVIAPLKDTPAARNGIKAGDFILKVGDKDTTNMTLQEAVSLIRGPKGTKIALEVFHEGDSKTTVISLTRDTIIVKSVEYESKVTPKGKKIAYIKLSSFGERTPKEWDGAISDALADAPAGVILDLRNNPGGFLEEAVFIASEFIARGDIVIQEDGQGDQKALKVEKTGKLLNQPLVALINKGSASAAEIVAGAIQDYKRGKLVGEQSFGKGTIQSSQDLEGGTGIHITTAKWLTPNERWIHNIGLTPDIKIDMPASIGQDQKDQKDPQLEKALELLDQ